MKEYVKETKSYEADVLKSCTCDKCGKTCDLSDKDFPKRTALRINPSYVSDDDYFSGDLCPECTKELLHWLNPLEAVKDLLMTIDIWED